MTWLTEATRHIAAATGLDPAPLQLEPAEREALLDLAGLAAHGSGDRTNAPLLCHVLGRAVAQGASLADLDRAVRDYTRTE